MKINLSLILSFLLVLASCGPESFAFLTDKGSIITPPTAAVPWGFKGYVEGDKVGDYIIKKSGLVSYEWDITQKIIRNAEHAVFWEPIEAPILEPITSNASLQAGTLFMAQPGEFDRVDSDYIYVSYVTEDGQITMYSMNFDDETVRLVGKFPQRSTHTQAVGLGLINKSYFFFTPSATIGIDLWKVTGTSESLELVTTFAANFRIGDLITTGNYKYLNNNRGLYFVLNNELFFLGPSEVPTSLGLLTSGPRNLFEWGNRVVCAHGSNLWFIEGDQILHTMSNPAGIFSLSWTFFELEDGIYFVKRNEPVYKITNSYNVASSSTSIPDVFIIISLSVGGRIELISLNGKKIVSVSSDLIISETDYLSNLKFFNYTLESLYFINADNNEIVKYQNGTLEPRDVFVPADYFTIMTSFSLLKDYADQKVAVGYTRANLGAKDEIQYYEFNYQEETLTPIDKVTVDAGYSREYIRESMRILAKQYPRGQRLSVQANF